jgi:hypothetical protein
MWLSGLQKEGRHYTTKLGAMHVPIFLGGVARYATDRPFFDIPGAPFVRAGARET